MFFLAPIQYERASTTLEVIDYVFQDKAVEAKIIAKCESSLQPDVVVPKDSNGLPSTGLFMINGIHGIPVEKLKDPLVNAQYAKKLYDKQGWKPWANCMKKNHLSTK